MGFSESSHVCKKHPNHQEKQGVCPSCLRERLSRLCSSSSHKESNLSVAPSPPFSPARHRHFHKRNGSGVMGTMGSSSSFSVKVGSNGLKKSRSIAFVARNFDGNEKVNEGKEKGFWSKLLRFKGKNKDFLTHSSSMRLIIGRVN